jgi:hypothetical protein
MWIYRGELLTRRRRVAGAVGFFLDYWLFLHNETTHSIWKARPFGLAVLGKAAHDCGGAQDGPIRKALKAELLAVRRWLDQVKSVRPFPVSVLPVDGRGWSAAVLDWFAYASSEQVSSAVADHLILQVANAIWRGDLGSLAYFTRKLAEHVASDETPAQSLSLLARSELLSDQFAETPHTVDTLVAAITTIVRPHEKIEYQVVFGLLPAQVSKRQFRNSSLWPLFVLEDCPASRLSLVGLSLKALAARPEQAAMIALNSAVQILEALRIRYNLRTHLAGPLRVSNGETEVFVPLPKPFWRSANPVRPVPYIPADSNYLISKLPEKQKRRQQRQWDAARWHLSSAYSQWAEDSHASAAQTWYAIETFIGKDAQSVADAYVKTLVDELAEYLATCVARQKEFFQDASESGCDWFSWQKDKSDVGSWLSTVFSTRSRFRYRNWKNPPAPELLFAEDVGLLGMVNNAVLSGTLDKGLHARLRADLEFLYSLRNKTVHEGCRIFPRSTAEYLGRLGLDVVFGSMRLRRERMLVEASAAESNLP